MPVLAPIVAGVGGYMAGTFAAGMVTGTLASITIGVAAGAVVGAAIGAIGTLVVGGDLKENALTGAFAGALGGGFGGYGVAKAGASGDTMWSAGTGSAESQMMSSPTAMEYAATATGKANTTNAMAAVGASAGNGAAGGLTTGEGMALSTGMQAVGGLMESYGAADAAKQQREWSKEDAELAFQRDLEKMQKQHEYNMAQIAESGGGGDGVEIARINNAGAASRQDDQQEYETETRKSGWEREDAVRDRFNESVAGVPTNAFERPVFDFAEATVFESVATGGMKPKEEVA